MDWLSIIAAAVAGAIGSLIGTFASRRVDHKILKSVVRILPIILAIDLVGPLLNRTGLRDLISPRSAFEKAAEKYAIALMQEPAFKTATAGMNENDSRGFIQRESHLGLKRLSINDLERWNAIRLEMASHDAAICASFWTGRGRDSNTIMNAYSNLSPVELDDFARISLGSAKLEIDQAPFTAYDGKPEDNFIKIHNSLSEADGLRFENDVKQGVLLDDSEACWTMKTILHAAAEGSQTDRESLLRLLASM